MTKFGQDEKQEINLERALMSTGTAGGVANPFPTQLKIPHFLVICLLLFLRQ